MYLEPNLCILRSFVSSFFFFFVLPGGKGCSFRQLISFDLTSSGVCTPRTTRGDESKCLKYDTHLFLLHASKLSCRFEMKEEEKFTLIMTMCCSSLHKKSVAFDKRKTNLLLFSSSSYLSAQDVHGISSLPYFIYSLSLSLFPTEQALRT